MVTTLPLPELDAVQQPLLGPIATLEEMGSGLTTDHLRFFSEGIRLSELGEYAEAVVSYRRGLQYAPTVPQAWYNIGTAFGQLGQYLEALEALDHATNLMPNYVDAWHNKGVAFARLARHEEALEAFKQTLGKRADDAEACQSIGSVLLAARKTEEALEAFSEALSSGHDDPLMRVSIGVTLARLGRHADANREFQKAYEVENKESVLAAILYKAWAASTLSLGVNSLLDQDIRTFEKAGLEYIAILEKAQRDNACDLVEEVQTQYKNQLKKNKQRQGLSAFEELEMFIYLMKIEDPFEGWRALGKELSKVWPKGVSAVQAVWEIRR